LSIAGAACADPTFDAFQALCVKTRAQPAAALAAADARGWTDMPAMFRDEIAKQGFSAGEGRAKSINRVLTLMYAGKGAPVIEGAPVPVRACAVGARPADSAALKKLAAAFAAVPPDPGLPVSKGHHENWMDCIKTRQAPISPVELGHRACSTCLLHHIAMHSDGRHLHWDPQAERFINDAKANARLSRPQRPKYPLA